MSEWKKVKLVDICQKISYGYTASATDDPVGPKFLRITDIRHGYIDWEQVPYCEISALEKEKYQLNIGDICVARTGASTGVSTVIKHEVDAVFASYLIRFQVDRQVADPFFVGYVLQSQLFKNHVTGILGGSAQPNANAKQFGSFIFLLPPLPVQRRIAQILGRLDDKIEVNRRINRTLEAMARALYRHWFVDFGPFQDGKFVESELGLIPKGWEVSTIGTESKVVSGGTPSTKVAEYWEDGDIYWATPTDMTSLYAPVIFDTKRKITQLGLKNSSAKLLPPGSVLVTSRATLGVAAINYVPMSTNQGFKSMIPGDRVTAAYLWLYVQHNQDEIHNRASGTTFMEINSRNFKALPILVPPIEIMRAFDRIVSKYFDQIYALEQETVQLAETRDYLLPKLLSGEVEEI